MVSEVKEEYLAKIKTLLDKYEEGWDVFKNADDWDNPVHIKEKYQSDYTLPTSWISLADEVIRIIAHDKYGLDTYANRIELINYDQMLNVYVSTGMPTDYNHWSLGKQKAQLEQQYKNGQMGLAYEMVINSNPSISYCMENNSKLMQMLVIAHAAYGHNSFFKGNYLFKEFTNANEVLTDMKLLKNMIRQAEEEYGVEEVELLLDACHTLKWHGVDLYKDKPKKSRKEEKADLEAKKTEYAKNIDPDTMWVPSVGAKTRFNKASNDDKKNAKPSYVGEENLLKFMANYSPVLEVWQRDIIKAVSKKDQYFFPQMQTKLMNEGWASFWHYTIMTDLHKHDLINNSMFMEFIDSHSGVLNQPGEKVMVRNRDGSIENKQVFVDLNPYKLGFEIFNDIKRICEEPTEEDKEWFPEFAGKGDWLGHLKYAMHNFRDDSFVHQYLSPKIIRDFHLFAIEDLGEYDDYVHIPAIHDADGYERIREILSEQYSRSNMFPHIEVKEYDPRSSDRELILEHKMVDDRPLDTEDTEEVLNYMSYLWGFPVKLESVDADGVVVDELESQYMLRFGDDNYNSRNSYKP